MGQDNKRVVRSTPYDKNNHKAAASSSGHWDPPVVIPLPEDLMYEIFIRLSWRSLLRFRCVSKVFLELIDNPLFIQRKKHDDQFHDSVSDFTVIITKIDGIYSIDFNFPHNISHVVEEKKLHPPLGFNHSFTGCCNGILCLMSKRLESYMLWNPFNETFQKVCYPYKVWDNAVSVGFGYDHMTDDYKIVMLQHAGCNNDVLRLCVYTYSMKRDSWQRVIREFHPGTHDHDNINGICVGNTIHWLWYYDYKVCRFIAAFDLGTERLKTVCLPLGVDVIKHESTLHDLRGRLCLCVSDKKSLDCNILWVMEEYGVKSSWTPLCRINNVILAIGYFPIWNNRLLCFGPDYKTLSSLSFCWFNPQDKSMSKLRVQLLPQKGPYHYKFVHANIIIPFKNKLRLRNSNLNHQ